MYAEKEYWRPTLKEIKMHEWVCQGPLPTNEEIMDEINYINSIKEGKIIQYTI